MRRTSAVLAVLAACCTAGCAATQPGNDDVLGTVGDFSLTERGGRSVARSDLSGRVWVASFVFTRCTTSCPQISHAMSRLQTAVADLKEVSLVSITVDPEHDTPEVLQGYAARCGADANRWLFLTGPREEIYRLIGEDFKLYAKPNEGEERKPGYEVAHQNKVAVVDGQGRIRGYYEGTDPEDMPKLVRQVRLIVWQNRLPGVNAVLNTTCALLLVVGYVAVRRRWIGLHKTCMMAALAVSAIFLSSYLYYHFVVRGGEPTRLQGPDGVRVVYFAILLSHTVLAVVVAPLALFTAYAGLRNRLQRHVKVARWTLPIWLYVSVTGVVVYVMLYRLYPPS